MGEKGPGSVRGGYDEVSKAAVTAAIVEVLRLAGVDGLDGADPPEVVAVLPVELRATVHEVDLLFRLRDGRLVHVEIQFRPDPDMGRRSVEYGVRLAAAYPDRTGPDAAVQIVVQITGAPMSTRWQWAGIAGMFHLVHIPTMDSGLQLATPALAPFALIGSREAVVPQVAAQLAGVRDPRLQQSLVQLALRLAPDLTGIIIEALRRNPMSTEIIVEQLLTTDVGQTIRDQGIEQGIEQGVASERYAAVLAILRHRFSDADVDRISRTAHRLTAFTATSPEAALDAAFAVEHLDS